MERSRDEKMISWKTVSLGQRLVTVIIALVTASFTSVYSAGICISAEPPSVKEGIHSAPEVVSPLLREQTVVPEAKRSEENVPVIAPAAVVAWVGDSAITEEELQEAVHRKVRSVYSHVQGLERNPKYRREALNELVDAILLFHGAQKRGITISDDEIDVVVAENIKQLGSEKALQEVLKGKGITLDTFRSRIRRYRSVNELLGKLLQESIVTDEELKKYYEDTKESFRRPYSIHLYHILLKVEPSAPEEEWRKKKETAEDLLNKLRAGEEFYDIAYKYSEDPFRVKGGDLGFIHKGMMMDREAEEVAFALQPGELSAVIRTIEGFHIMKAGDRKPGELIDFGMVRDDLSKTLQKKRFEEMKAEILKRMKDEYPVRFIITSLLNHDYGIYNAGKYAAR